MNIFYLVEKQLKHNIRNIKSLMMMVLFPIVLILVLGSALSGIFEGSASFGNIGVLYSNEGSNDTAAAFKIFVDKGKDLGITFKETKNIQEGIENIKGSKYACFLLVDKDSGEIEMYKNTSTNIQASMVQAFLSSFTQRYNVISVIAKENPSALNKVTVENSKDFVSIQSLTQRKTTKAMDYYSISIITLFILYSSMTGAFSVKNERTLKTADRLLCSPIKKYEILMGKILGTFLVSVLQVAIVFVFTKFVLKVDWGMNIGLIVIILLSEILMTVSLGIGLAFIIKNDMAINAVLQTIIPFIAFLGGSYIPVDNFNKYLLYAAEFTPLRWVNRSIFQVVYVNDFSTVAGAVIINLAVAVLFVAIASVQIRKEA